MKIKDIKSNDIWVFISLVLLVVIAKFMITALIIILLMVLLSIILFIIQGVFTPRVGEGRQKYVIQGGKHIKTLTSETEMKNLFWSWLGVYFVGFKFNGYNLKVFTINTDKENPDPIVTSIDQFLLRGEPKKMDYLLEKIPRGMVIVGSELGGNDPVKVDVGISLAFELVDGVKFGFKYKADFTMPLSIIQSRVNAELSRITSYANLIAKEDNFLDYLTNDQKLTEDLAEFGLKLIKIKMPFKATDTSIEAAARLKTIAEMEQDAKKVEFETLNLEATAKANFAKQLAGAPLEGIKSAISGMNADELEALKEIQKSANIMNSKILTWVEGGGKSTTAIIPKND